MNIEALQQLTCVRKIFRGYLWIGLTWLAISVVCILVAELFMDDTVHGNYGRLVFYRTWGPTALIGACVAAASHRIGRSIDRSAK